MSQHQPSWASPQQPDEGDAPTQPRRKRSIGKIAGIWLGSAAGLFIVLGVIGEATGAGKSTNASAPTSPSPTKTSIAPTQAAKTTAPAKPTPSAKTAAPVKASATSAPAPKLATADARRKAAAILEQEDQDFRDFLAQGGKAVGTPDWPAWDQKAIAGLDMKQTAFSKADAYFTADNEPTDLLEQWRADNGDANAAITRFAGTGPEMDAQSRQIAANCLAALTKADKDAEKIANGG
ncbi:hypothetical protein [Streptomyces sp. NPDC046942]|uniref:hypothetical protein n=1 Tax=Streptomyces sp. NPDC046942 TaxID=3155137 RepID=UPI0034098F5F